MSTESQITPLELKAVSTSARTIEGYSSVFGVLDRQGDLVVSGAFRNTLAEKKPSDVGVYVNHRTDRLPIGVPLEIREDQYGLFTKSKIFRTTAGDDLLATATELQAAGASLAMSIGYKARQHEWRRTADATFRALLDVDLQEYSYVPAHLAANPVALVSAVKQAPRTMAEITAEIDEMGRWLDERKYRDWWDARMQRERRQRELDALLTPEQRLRAHEDELEAKGRKLLELLERHGMDHYDECRRIAGLGS
jgi:HK97 family phage prohead protease